MLKLEFSALIFETLKCNWNAMKLSCMYSFFIWTLQSHATGISTSKRLSNRYNALPEWTVETEDMLVRHYVHYTAYCEMNISIKTYNSTVTCVCVIVCINNFMQIYIVFDQRPSHCMLAAGGPVLLHESSCSLQIYREFVEACYMCTVNCRCKCRWCPTRVVHRLSRASCLTVNLACKWRSEFNCWLSPLGNGMGRL